MRGRRVRHETFGSAQSAGAGKSGLGDNAVELGFWKRNCFWKVATRRFHSRNRSWEVVGRGKSDGLSTVCQMQWSGSLVATCKGMTLESSGPLN